MKDRSENKSSSSSAGKKKNIIILLGVFLLLALAALFMLIPKWQQTNMQKKLNIGQSCLSEGKYEEAILAYQDIIKVNEKEKDAYKGLSESYAGMGDYQQAEEIAYNGIDKLEDKDQKAELYQVLVDLYTEDQKPQKAVETLKAEAFQETAGNVSQEKQQQRPRCHNLSEHILYGRPIVFGVLNFFLTAHYPAVLGCNEKSQIGKDNHQPH